MEKIRIFLIRWNAAPIFIIAFFCYMANKLVNVLLESDSETGIFATILAGVATGIFGFLFKMYESLQRDRDDNKK